MQLLTVIKNNTGNRAAVITSSLKARCEFGSLVQVSEESPTIIVRRMQANRSNILVNSYPVVVTLYSSCTRDNGLKMDQLDKRKFRFYSFCAQRHAILCIFAVPRVVRHTGVTDLLF